MADVTLTYKGDTIAELSESGSKTIETAGKYCEADILLEYKKSGAAIQHGLEILTFDANGLPATAKIHGQLTPREFYYFWYNLNKRVTVELDADVDHIPAFAFYQASIGIDQNSLNRIKTADESAFACLASTSINLDSETLYLPEFTGEASTENQCLNRFKNSVKQYYKKIHCPKMQKIGQYDFQDTKTPSWEREIGSIGYPVTTVKTRPFQYTAVAGTATIFINPSDLSTISAAVEANVTAGVVTFIYKSATTGETLQTNVR